MSTVLLVSGVLVAGFVAYNIGGATTGPAFGPAVGAGAIGKVSAAALMSIFFFGGAWTLGRRVVETLGSDLVTDPGAFTLEVSIVILFFIGGALMIGNMTGVPASTSMTAVGAIAGFGLATEVLDFAVVGEIVSWWILSPVIGFWVSVMIGRYLYTSIDRAIALDQSPGALLRIDRSGTIPRVAPGENITTREIFGTITVVGIGCLMAFSSGASNVANAVAPLVGSGELGMNVAIVIGSAAVAIGTFTIARRTMETLGNDITDLPLTAAVIVAVVSSVIVVLLSAAGIPVQFVIIATLSIVGLGWGRATRAVTIVDAVRGETVRLSTGALGADRSPTVGDPSRTTESVVRQPIGETSAGEMPVTSDLFDPGTTGRVVLVQNLVPILATVGAYLTF